jgi:hypothetical protein
VSNPTGYGPIKTSGTALSNRGTTNARNGNTYFFASKLCIHPESLGLNIQLVLNNFPNEKTKTNKKLNKTKKTNIPISTILETAKPKTDKKNNGALKDRTNN